MSAALPLPPNHVPEALPARIGAYDVRAVIGTGSMGVVYLGHDPVINRRVAIKTIQRHLLEAGAQQHGAAARFRVEAQAAGRLNHRNIVSVYQFGQDENCAYIVMEYVDGHSLSDYLRRPERLTKEEVLCLMFQLLDALHYAHEAGVVHRDVKPANLMVDREGRLKITDFGIARTESSQLTRVNAVVGSPGYMAPEQYTGGALDRRVDVFSAGVLLYQMLAGMMPFSGSDEAIMYQIVYGQHGQMSLRSGDASLAVYDAIVDGALAKLPADRFANTLEFRDALKAVAPGPIPERLPASRLMAPRVIAAPTLETEVPTRIVRPPAAPSAAAAPAARPAVAPSSPATSPAPAPTPAPRPSGYLGSGVDSILPSSLPVPTGWDETELTGLERELTRYVGPVAKVLVRRAARGQADISEVRRLVASSIVDPDVRERFLTSTQSGAGSGSGPRSSFRNTGFGPSAFSDTRPSVPHDGVRLKPEDIEKAGVALARALGPIGKVLARRCGEGATTREQFIARVLEQLAARVDARAVEAELRRSMT